MNNKKEDYKRLKREIRFKIRKEKKEWLINECSKITAANEHRKSKELYQQIKKVKGTKIFVKNQCVKDKDGNTLTDSKEVLGRWQDYGKSLFSLDDRNTSNDDIVFPNENLEPEPLLDEVLSAINQLIMLIMLIIILNRLRNKVEFELSECQAGYRSNRGTIDMLFVLQILIEKVRNTRDEAFITFIDYSKAFDSVIHQHLFKVLIEMGFPVHLVSLIANLYQNQKATIRWNGDHCDFFNIEKGVRQGCILSPHLFSMYTEQVMREADLDSEGVKISGEKISNLRYADDTALLADSYDSMCNVLDKVNEAGERSGLKLNAKKTKVMLVNSKNDYDPILINGDTLEFVDDMKYLGSIKESDGSCSKDVKTRIAMAKRKMIDLNNIWKDRGIPTVLKVQLLKSLIWPVMMYGCEAWKLRSDEVNKINAAELWFYRRLLRVSWTDKRTNESILSELKTERILAIEIDKRRLRYVGHAVRHKNTSLMSTVLMGRVEGKRKQGRPAKNLPGNLIDASGCSGLQAMVDKCRDRDGWRALVSSRVAPTVDPGEGDE